MLTSISSSATPLQLAGLFHSEPGFVWLDGGPSGHWIFRLPSAFVVSDGVRPSLDLLRDAERAWRGSGALFAGFVSYDLAEELESIGVLSGGFPNLHLGVYESYLRYDGAHWFAAGSAGEWLRRADAAPSEFPFRSEAVPEGDDAQFAAGVARIVRRIYQGDFFQTNLCRRLEAALPAEMAWPLYCRMRLRSPAEYGAFLQLGHGRSILSISPEMFLKVTAGVAEARPIKGTRRRQGSVDRDREALQDLLASEKDAAELAMIVDVMRNDLGRVCQTGSVTVEEHRAAMTLPTLLHTYSRITGRLKPGVTPAGLLAASFPPASISGAPKIAAVQAALAEEGQGRGPCMGSIGWISPDGDLELSVAIRTAYTRGGKVIYLAGCGITADSEPAAELEESRSKAIAFTAAFREGAG